MPRAGTLLSLNSCFGQERREKIRALKVPLKQENLNFWSFLALDMGNGHAIPKIEILVCSNKLITFMRVLRFAGLSKLAGYGLDSTLTLGVSFKTTDLGCM